MKRWLLMWAFRLAVVVAALLLVATAPLWAPLLGLGWLYWRHRKATAERRMLELLIAHGAATHGPALSLLRDEQEPSP